MAEYIPLLLPENPKLAQNIAHFARALRHAGLPVGPGRVVDAIQAISAAGFTNRTDFYHALAACFISRPEHRLVFAQTFRLFWRDPRYLEHMMSLMLPSVRGVSEERKAQAAERRAAQALLQDQIPEIPESQQEEGGEEVEIKSTLTMSMEERLRTLDFEQMTAAELAEAKRRIAALRLPVPPLISRRLSPSINGARIDARKSLRAALRNGGELRQLPRSAPRTRPPTLVALCDISGSMSQYSRAMLHFLHAISNDASAGWGKVHAFTFGTRLTNITRHLKARDVDAALAAAGAEAQDWQGGTRIGETLARFNRDWSRRVLGQGAVVLLITDGLERGDPHLLQVEAGRLGRSARKLIWINPLLRWEEFAPKAAGIQAILPHVDVFRTGHNIASIEGLAQALSGDSGEKDRMLLAMRAHNAK
ncbi:VWA domain-containing protein [Donghicola sp. C2-DW-16]|uniref:VWA domain-containing protein n=1 Tax=Donghicola mangrovi TaxID=2729614 RepID=A0ABX2PD29_9RHOB|nr:VWA domain-containing protein [Donghicola mangrovi]NVO27371.1 VWA domain-containing protein [Donghicola mangrovi]